MIRTLISVLIAFWLSAGSLGATLSCPQALVQASTASSKSYEAHWKEVGFPFELLSTMVNNETCFAGEIPYEMCVAAINFLLQLSEPRLILAPTARLGMTTEFGDIVRTFGPVEVVKKKIVKIPNEAASAQHLRESTALKLYHDLWMALFKSEALVDFAGLLKWAKQFVAPDRESFLTAVAFNEAFRVADAHSRLEPESRHNESYAIDAEAMVGVGVILSIINGKALVLEVMAGSPAERVGIKAKDSITHINGESLSGKYLGGIVQTLRGKAGSQLRLQFERGREFFTAIVTREEVLLPNVDARVFDVPGGKVGVLRLHNFMSKAAIDQVGDAIKTVEAAGAKGIVLDLRGNGGGLIDSAVDIASHFVGPEKKVVLQKSLEPDFEDTMSVTDGPQLTQLPLIVLQNRDSASASELLAGILQDLKRAFIVGERSYGKGTMQMPRFVGKQSGPFKDYKVVMFQTVATFHTPSGRTNQLQGITPDFEVWTTPDPSAEEKFALRERELYPNAVPNPWKPFEQTRTKEISAVQACLERTALAREIFSQRRQSSLPLDFQLLHAADVMRCLWEN